MPANASRSRSGGRFYTWRQERYWSVTTILKALPKDALKFWAAGKVAEFAFDQSHVWLSMDRGRAVDWLKREPLRFTGDRADFGTSVHATAEALALGRPLPRAFETMAERQACANLIRWARTFGVEWEATEASVYNRAQRYAGTLDTIALIPLTTLGNYEHLHPWKPSTGATTKDGTPAIRLLIDYKTGGDVTEGKGIYPEVGLQLNAYAGAEFIGGPNGAEVPLPPIDGCAVLQLGPAGYRFVPIRYSPDLFNAFLYVREVYRFIEQTSRDVIGQAIEYIVPEDEPTDEGDPDD